MNHHDDSFAPESIDEQIDQLLQTAAQHEHNSPAQMVQILQGIYAEDTRLRRVWERLAGQMTTTQPADEPGEITAVSSKRHQQTLSASIVRFPQEKSGSMQTRTRAPEDTRKHTFFQRHLSQLVAAILLAVLVGGLVTMLHLARQQPSGQTGAPSVGSTAGPKPGRIVYSTSPENGWVSDLAWSADGQRVVAVGSQTHIWDATTGQHQVTLTLNSSPLAGPAWSPKSNLLAIPTTNSVLIVDGQSGKTVITYPAPATTAMTPSAGIPALIGLMPLGGAPNFGGITWSPDGKLVASTFSSATSAGMVQVWNPQTGQIAYSLATQAGWGFGSIAWSPDGQYIAATAWKWDGTVDQLDVWSVATHQIVFQQSGDQEFDGVTWQPGTDNVASPLLKNNAVNSAVLHIWNVTSKQLIKTIPGVAGVSWSPDGQEFVYSDLGGSATKASVTILNVNTSQKVYTFQTSEPTAPVDGMSGVWSPTGTYIVTVENIQSAQTSAAIPQQSYVVKVWVA